jgi:ribosomal protein L11 methyltransferase
MTFNRSPRAATLFAALETDRHAADRIGSLLIESAAADEVAIDVVDNGHGRFRMALHVAASADQRAIRELIALAAGQQAATALRFEPLPARDWVAESLAGLHPVSAGRFIVHGAHDRARIAANRIGIEIEAAAAFGTGHHGTTHGCLIALDQICRFSAGPRRNLNVLDLGTGSGVLAIAAARALRCRVLATDIDPEAVRAARGNARCNSVAPRIAAIQCDGVARLALLARSPFDLVFANILLGPLQRFAVPLIGMVAPGGRIVLSGLLAAQANAALDAYRTVALERRIDRDGWTTLVLIRRVRPRPAVAHSRRRP